MEQQKKEAIELSKIEVEYKPLQRASEQNTKMYGLIASRQKEIDITGPMKTNNVRVLERAIVPRRPVRPKPVQNLLIGLAARARDRHRSGVRDRGAGQHAQDAGGRRAVPGRAGAGAGADHRCGAGAEAAQAERQPARARPGRLPRSEVGGRRVLPLDPDEHPVHVARSSAADDGRDQPEPPGGKDHHRHQPRASRWPRRAAAS